jgi:AcrR family transcriptional regulator
MSALSSLRERKKAITRATIQEQALRLFLAKGYNGTTVEEIAAAAGVSHMTFFRYFPTKEDVVLTDEYDALIAEQISTRPADEPVVEKVRHAFREGLDLIYAANRTLLLARTRLIIGTPALRARLWEQQHATERLIVTALAASHAGSGGPTETEYDLGARVVAAACLAAITTAVEVWAESTGSRELPDMIDQALTALVQRLGGTNG